MSETPLSEVVRFRVSPEEKAALFTAADTEGLGLSQWMRQVLFFEKGYYADRRDGLIKDIRSIVLSHAIPGHSVVTPVIDGILAELDRLAPPQRQE